LALAAVAPVAPAQSLTTSYVATDGSDTNDGSRDSPFGTFHHAIAQTGPGDTIYVRGGTYLLDSSIVIDKSGAPSAPIKLGQDASELRLYYVVAFGNKAFGIDANGNRSRGGVKIYNATLANNAKSGNPVQLSLQDGSPHTVRNSIAYDVDSSNVVQLDADVDGAYNSWNGIDMSEADFESLDMTSL
jgi:hypothetical protein